MPCVQSTSRHQGGVLGWWSLLEFSGELQSSTPSGIAEAGQVWIGPVALGHREVTSDVLCIVLELQHVGSLAVCGRT